MVVVINITKEEPMLTFVNAVTPEYVTPETIDGNEDYHSWFPIEEEKEEEEETPRKRKKKDTESISSSGDELEDDAPDYILDSESKEKLASQLGHLEEELDAEERIEEEEGEKGKEEKRNEEIIDEQNVEVDNEEHDKEEIMDGPLENEEIDNIEEIEHEREQEPKMTEEVVDEEEAETQEVKVEDNPE